MTFKIKSREGAGNRIYDDGFVSSRDGARRSEENDLFQDVLLFCSERKGTVVACERSLAITFLELIAQATVSNGVTLPLTVKVRSGL